MNPTKKLKFATTGKEYIKSFYTDEETEALPKKDSGMKDGEQKPIMRPDLDKMERETVGNVIMNCLARYKPENNKEVILVNIAMQSFIDAEDKEMELKQKIKDLVIKVLYNQTFHDEFPDVNNPNYKVEVGAYYAWVTGQVLQELGVTEDAIA